MTRRFVCSRTPRIAGAGLIAATLVFMAAFRGAQATGGQSAAATWSEGVLHVTIPYDGLQAGSGQLRIEVLDPEDNLLGSSERRVQVGDPKGSWQADLKLAKPLTLDELVWHRVRYRFGYSNRTDAAAE